VALVCGRRTRAAFLVPMSHNLFARLGQFLAQDLLGALVDGSDKIRRGRSSDREISSSLNRGSRGPGLRAAAIITGSRATYRDHSSPAT